MDFQRQKKNRFSQLTSPMQIKQPIWLYHKELRIAYSDFLYRGKGYQSLKHDILPQATLDIGRTGNYIFSSNSPWPSNKNDRK